MRVIAGKYKGRSLVSPKEGARPTLDRMKETLFNILNFKLRDAVVLDLFAGSGQLAIECLSRGASRVVMCDNSRYALAAIQENFAKIKVEPEIYCRDYAIFLSNLSIKFDLILVDPPYQSGYYENVLTKISEYDLLTEDGWVVCEHLAECDLPQAINGLAVFDSRKIGTVKFDFYKRS